MEEKFDKYFAAIEEDTQRVHSEKEHKFRTKFERDRDRILYSKAFRRLSGKTQIFLSTHDDHLRTRLTHTMEVSQIALTIAKQLNLDLDLTEAIALGHDIGHTPFGHIGERTLNLIMNGCYDIKGVNSDLDDAEKGFKHNWQGLRVLTELEKYKNDYKGLNLTPYTLNGILGHSSLKYKECMNGNEGKCLLDFSGKDCHIESEELNYNLGFYIENENMKKINEIENLTIEGLVVKIADEIAQRHHDIEDGIESKLVEKDEIIEKFEEFFEEDLDEKKRNELSVIKKESNKEYYLPLISSFIVNYLTTDLINNSKSKLIALREKIGEKSFFEYKKDLSDKKLITDTINYSDKVKGGEDKLGDFLYKRMLNSHIAQTMDGKGAYIIRKLFKAYVTNPQQLPNKTIVHLFEKLEDENFDKILESKSEAKKNGELRKELNKLQYSDDKKFKVKLLRTVCEYIGGMTDKFAIEKYKELYESNI